jgi:hypothetical protein
MGGSARQRWQQRSSGEREQRLLGSLIEVAFYIWSTGSQRSGLESLVVPRPFSC